MESGPGISAPRRPGFPNVVVRAEFGQVVDNARSHCDGNGVGAGQHPVQLFDERPLGIKFRVGENMRLVLRNTRLSQNPVNIAAGRPPRIGIGDDKRTPAGKEFLEHIRDPRKGFDSDYQSFGIGRARQSAFYFIHYY